MNRSRHQTPKTNVTVLAEPKLDEVGSLLTRNRALLDAWNYDFQGRSAARVRGMTRAAILHNASQSPASQDDNASRTLAAAMGAPTDSAKPISSTVARQPVAPDPPPFLVSGHQPELFHPGVWVKNFASYELSQRYGGVSLHLVVDNDTVKRTTVRVPTGTLEQPSVVHVPFDQWRGEIPYEEYEISDDSLFAAFGDRVASVMEPMGVRPMVTEFWPLAVAARRQSNRLAECMARARHVQETRWNCDNLELPVSRLCQTEGFRWFASHIMAQLGPFRAAYNAALAEYRRRNRVRSRNHPVPSLSADSDWQEAPFWVWSEQSPHRRRLFVRPHGRELQLTDRDQWTFTLPLSADREACCAVEAMADLARQGVKIRTRALTTTIFSRLCLGDLFIHGLGGARYDELTDAIIERFFGVRPPQIVILTGTLRLPLATRSGTIEQLHELERLVRDLKYSPQRFIPESAARLPEVASLIEVKREWVAGNPSVSSARRKRFDVIRRINNALAPKTETIRAATDRTIEAVRADIAANSILQNRDWPFCAYPAESLRRFFELVKF